LHSAARTPAELAKELRFLRDSRNRIRDVDLLLVSGSNQFLDNFGGVWGFPYTVLKWSILAKLAGAKLAFLSVGAGPIDSKISRVFVRMALRLADYASFRDQASKQLIEQKKSRRFGEVFPDLAHGLTFRVRDASRKDSPGGAKRPTVGINPMPVYDRRYWHAPDDRRYQEYVERLASFACMLRRDGYGVFFFPTQTRDESVIRDILLRLNKDARETVNRQELVREAKSVSGLMDVYAEADMIVATRFHGVLLALRAERPVLGISYFRKTRDLLREMGQEACAVDLETFTAPDLYERLKTLETKRAEALDQIHKRGEVYRADLRAQYAQVFELMVEPTRESA
jgi:polysaccharide pyruvyl transferase WcaK-like protein